MEVIFILGLLVTCAIGIGGIATAIFCGRVFVLALMGKRHPKHTDILLLLLVAGLILASGAVWCIVDLVSTMPQLKYLHVAYLI